MAGSREERFLMRQRGAGTRDIVLAFDLELPGVPQISKTPLKPQKSSRSRQYLQPELPPIRSTRKTPKSVTTKPTSLSKPTPTTARPQRTKATVGDIARDEVSGSGDVRHDGRGSVTTKRKRKATEDISETQTMAPLKKQRKRRSIGQQTLKRKPRASLAPVGPVDLPGATPGSRQLRHVEANNTEATAEQQDDATNKPSGSVTIPDADKEEKTKVQMLEKPRKRKRKSIGQTQRRKAKPTAIQPGTSLDKADLVEEALAPTKVEDPVEYMAVGTETKAKPRKRKRKAIAQSPKKCKKISPPKRVAPVVRKVEERRKRLRQEPGTDLSMAVTTIEKRPAKRGRKPKSITKASPKPPKTATETIPKAPKSEKAPAELSLAEAQPQAELDPQAPKRKGKKRRSIGQVQRPRKKGNIDSTIEVPLAIKNADPKVETVIQAPEAMTAPETKRKSRLKKPPVSIAAITGDRQKPEHEHVPSLQAPKKRGRPKKATLSVNVDIPVTAEASEHLVRQADTNKPQKLRREKRTALATANESIPLPQEPDIPMSSQDPTPQPPPNVKKRGRPKKQDLSASIVELNIGSSESRQFQAKSGRSTTRVKSPLAKIHEPSASAVLQKPISAIRAMTCARDDEDDEDPLSDLAPLRPRTKLTTKQSDITKPQRKHLRTDSNPPPTEPTSINKTRSLDLEVRTNPTNSQDPPAPEPQELPSEATTTAVTTSLASHLRASRVEEKALRKDLLKLQAQQASEIAEQKDRDLAARLESLSASVRKRKLESRMEVGRNQDERKERRVGKGLE
ncbi:MAG: hypothetical protein Q9188_002218, partial [Gyalolechia gomerana]